LAAGPELDYRAGGSDDVSDGKVHPALRQEGGTVACRSGRTASLVTRAARLDVCLA
jgi:hypothetical protein